MRGIGCIEKLVLDSRALEEKNALDTTDKVVCSYLYNVRDFLDYELAFNDSKQKALEFIQQIGYFTKLVNPSKETHKNSACHVPLELFGDNCCGHFIDFTRIPISGKDVKLRV